MGTQSSLLMDTKTDSTLPKAKLQHPKTGNVEEEEEEEGEEKGIIVLRINLVTVEVRYRMPRSPPGIESILSVHNGIAEDNEQTRRELRKRIATRESDPTDQRDAERTSSIYTCRKVINCTLEP
ncbi:hypothetical protein T07_11718 [Trichinella nelsoni]|uniref:Uncharacterized protein n=1 Tax=Trichinella nelsoni TaxID=6336 RepID=A0A0V0S486_9BILA|nr:hypothetical protein T07_11718 [Trichinella nelsoni]